MALDWKQGEGARLSSLACPSPPDREARMELRAVEGDGDEATAGGRRAGRT